MHATKETTRPNSVSKLSIRVERELHEDVKAVASLSGKNVEQWVKGVVRNELKRMEPAIQALRTATSR